MINKKILLAIALASIPLITPLRSAAAGLYKWVDEQGITHYSQEPPATGKVQKIKPPPPPPENAGKAIERLEAQRQELDERRAARLEAARERQEEAKSEEIREAACRQARENLARLEAHNRIALRSPDGNYTYLDEEQRQQRIAEARDLVSNYCKD
ncbi:MAG: DUF4124 domain-containing protein [Gammaproteobacteria bacterium]